MMPEEMPMPPQFPPQYFDHSLRICGVNVLLRIFPLNNSYVFQTDRELSKAEFTYFKNYLRREGYFDNPITGQIAQDVV